MSRNEDKIREQIYRKKDLDSAYYCPSTIYRDIRTDMNEFPYRRFFRGKANATYPSVYGRDAGYSPIENSPAYAPRPLPETGLTDLCFQLPCSTILPCYGPHFLPNTRDCVFISP